MVVVNPARSIRPLLFSVIHSRCQRTAPPARALALSLAALLLLVRPSGTEWVEILHLKPSTLFPSTVTSTTIKPDVTRTEGSGVNDGGDFLVRSHLLSHLSIDRETSSARPSVTSIRFHQRPPISDLLDYAPSPSDGYGHQASPWVTVVDRGPSNVGLDITDSHRRVAMVNVSSKVEQWRPQNAAQQEQDEQGEEYVVDDDVEEQQEDDNAYPILQTQLLPFGNRYEEESIEVSSTSVDNAPKYMQSATHPHKQEAQHFDDFDDYDERMSLQHQQQHHVPNDWRAESGEKTEVEADRNTKQKAHSKPGGSKSGLRDPAMPIGFAGFVDFLRRMQANFVFQAAHSIGDKIRTLAGLRDLLLSSIQRRIAALWTVTGRAEGRAAQRRRRVRRGWMDPYAGADAMDFPSAEGALLTISFLTFAVFLIKLVLQVINTIKAKHYTYSTFTAATPVSGGLLVKRTRRNASGIPPPSPLPVALDQLYPSILSAINSYRLA